MVLQLLKGANTYMAKAYSKRKVMDVYVGRAEVFRMLYEVGEISEQTKDYAIRKLLVMLERYTVITK